MATPVHAFFCFEVLAASFTNSPHPTLSRLLDLYGRTGPIEEADDHGQQVGARGKQEQDQDAQSTSEDVQRASDQTPPQMRSITRLQELSSPTRSVSSTPSSASGRSSVSQTASSTMTDITIPSPFASRLAVTDDFPMFVTWNTVSRSGNKSLRGCIGTFEPLPLEKGLEQYAMTSAFEDTRFTPIPASLIPNLSCSLTLLADFEDCNHALDWDLGIHGIRISFVHRSRRHGATYLPDVALEQGWTKEETIESLMRKAGWEPGTKHLLRSTLQPWNEVKDFHVVRYTGLKASASYAEWQNWRQSVIDRSLSLQ